MAAFTTIAAVGVAAATTGSGIAKSIKGAKEAKKARRDIQSYERQDLSNVYDTAQISTLGSDLRREESARGRATDVEALRRSGTRGLIGGLGRVEQASNLVERQIGANLDEQQIGLERLRSQDEASMRGIQETREREELGALGQQYQVGKQQQQAGFGQALGGITAGVGALDRAKNGQSQQGGGFQQQNFSGFGSPSPYSASSGYGQPLV